MKLAEVYKRYIKSSHFCIRESKHSKKNHKLLKSVIIIKIKYDFCIAHIQMSPNLMSYVKIFKHSTIILSFSRGYSIFLKEINNMEEDKKNVLNKVKNKKKRKKPK